VIHKYITTIRFGGYISNLSFLFDPPIINKTVKYCEKQLIDVYLVLQRRLIANWSVENMTPDNGVLIDVDVSPTINK